MIEQDYSDVVDEVLALVEDYSMDKMLGYAQQEIRATLAQKIVEAAPRWRQIRTDVKLKKSKI